MNKVLCFILAALIMIMTLCCACGNMSMGPGNYNFQKVHVNFGECDECLEVVKWYDNEFGCEVKTPDGALYLSEGTYVLIEDKCPICDAAAR